MEEKSAPFIKTVKNAAPENLTCPKTWPARLVAQRLNQSFNVDVQEGDHSIVRFHHQNKHERMGHPPETMKRLPPERIYDEHKQQ